MRNGLWIPILLAFALMVTDIQAQTPFEALRYSQLRPGGTARALGVGGAYGALGGDFSSLSINPGGLGVYRRSEITATLNVTNHSIESNYNGMDYRYNQVRGSLGNLGLVITSMFEDRRGNRSRGNWISLSFALGHNRLADFNSRTVLTDDMAFNSYLADLRDELNSFAADITLANYSGETVGAYQAYLLNPDNGRYTAVTDGNFVNQELVIMRNGGINDINLSMATNYNHKLYFGASIGFPFLNYEEEIVVRERDLADTIPSFNSYSIENNLSTEGVGIYARFGFIYKPHKFIRLGAAFHTPTRYGLTENFNTNINSNIDTLQNQNFNTLGEFDYRFSSPLRTIISAAGMIKQHGFISVDYEYANFGRARYRFANEFVSAENELNEWVGNTLTRVHTIRVGAEAAIKSFRFRAGYAYSTTPLQNPDNFTSGYDWTSMIYSGGVGLKKERFFLDLTYFRTTQQSQTILASNISTTQALKRDNFVLTFGFTF